MSLTTDFARIQEKWQYLNDEKKLLILQIIDNFLPNDEEWAEEYPEDEHHIVLAEQELANGETASWDDVAWKKPPN